LKDSDNRTRSNAAKALFRLGDVEVLDELEKMLGSKDTATRISAAYVLMQIGLALREIEVSPLPGPLKTSLERVKVPVVAVVASVEPQGGEVAKTSERLPGSVDNVSDSREKARNRFLELFKAGRLAESLEQVGEFLQKHPHDLMAVFFSGNLNLQLSKFEAAVADFKKAVELDPFNFQAHSNLGAAFYRAGNMDSAIEHFKTALKLKPDLNTVRFNLASLFLKTARWEEAIRHFEEGMKHQSPTAKILTNLAFAFQKTGNFEKSADAYKKAIELDNKDPGNYYNLAITLVKINRRAEAMQLLQRSLNDVPEGTPGLQNLRDLLERLKAIK
jgi:tetratricopeptide (TPR) repeat protein